METSRKLIGRVGIDTGTIAIGDPCYIDKVISELEREVDLYAAVGDSTTQAVGAIYGALVCTGLGDGFYEVYVTVAEVDGVSAYVTKLEIVFMEQ